MYVGWGKGVQRKCVCVRVRWGEVGVRNARYVRTDDRKAQISFAPLI